MGEGHEGKTASSLLYTSRTASLLQLPVKQNDILREENDKYYGKTQ